MALLVPVGSQIIAPEPETPTTFPRPADPGTLQAMWIAPDGTEVPLTSPDLGWHSLDAPISIMTDPHPRGGVRVRHIQPQPRYITWPMRMRGATHLELIARWRYVIGAFTQTRRLGPGTLRIARPDGTAREIYAYYESGFHGEPGQGHTYDTAAINLFCEDPYWWDTADQPPIVREYVSTTVDYLDPYPQVSSGQSVDSGPFSINNLGEVEAWPVWTITGPMTSLIAENNTTGEAFTLTASLADNTEQIVIDTYEGTVTGPDDTSWFGFLDQPGAVLWGLAPGVNAVEFTMGGAATGSQVSLTWRNRWESA
jgi:hypothetical protein